MAHGYDTMMNPSIEDLLEKTGSKFRLVSLSAMRSREITSYLGQLSQGVGVAVPVGVGVAVPVGVGVAEGNGVGVACGCGDGGVTAQLRCTSCWPHPFQFCPG